MLLSARADCQARAAPSPCLRVESGRFSLPVMLSREENDRLTLTGKNTPAGGLLEQARAASVFTTPTINSYKRLKPFTLAPDRAVWSRDNRGAMIRAIGGAGDPGSRIENRIGEPAANPYLYIASQIAAGLNGLKQQRDPGAPSATPYAADVAALPTSLMEAVEALENSAFFRKAFGTQFIDYIVGLKKAGTGRFLSEVTDWEQREYFEIF